MTQSEIEICIFITAVRGSGSGLSRTTVALRSGKTCFQDLQPSSDELMPHHVSCSLRSSFAAALARDSSYEAFVVSFPFSAPRGDPTPFWLKAER